MADQNKNPKETPRTKDLPPKQVPKKDEAKVKGGNTPPDGRQSY